MKKLSIFAVLLFSASMYAASPKDTLSLDYGLTDEYLDTVVVQRKRTINNYSMLGVDYGVGFAQMTFNPSKHDRGFVICPNYFDIMFTHYEKLFGYIPNFAFRIGFAHAWEGVTFQKDRETGRFLGEIDGATRLKMELLEVPFLAGFHVDAAPVKLEAEVGIYGGYRKTIEREGPGVPAEYANAFRDYEFRWDYGLRGGAGIAFMIDPIELHFNAVVRWGWQSQYKPDYYSPYYYRYAYPLDFAVTAGIHFQLTKRSGKTSKDLRNIAKERVYGKIEDHSGEDRR